jgi:hypothetical protein
MDEAKPVTKPESIREWYQRTTKRARRALFWSTLVSFAVMGLMWTCASTNTLTRLQTFNGALTVPLIGGLWIFAFIFMFLVPSREASFRAQETLEDGVRTLHKFAEEEVLPVIQIWERIGQRIEKEYPELKKRLEDSVADLKQTAQRVEKALEENGELVKDARPVLAALKRIEDRFEADLLDDMKDMVEAVKRMSGVPPTAPAPKAEVPASSVPSVAVQAGAPVAPSASEPNLSAVLNRLQKRKNKEAATQPQES